MATINEFGVPLGSAPDKGHATTVSTVIDFFNGPRQVYEASGNGSAFDAKAFQSIFVDNSGNSFEVYVECIGSGLKLVVPGNAQAILPVACPIGSFGLIFELGFQVNARVPIVLFDIPLPYAVWPKAFASGGGGGGGGSGTYDPITNALLTTDVIEPSSSYTQLVTANSFLFTIYDRTIYRHRSLKIKNTGAETAYLQTDPGKDVEVSWPISPGETLSFDHVPDRSIQAYTTQNSTQLVVWAY